MKLMIRPAPHLLLLTTLTLTGWAQNPPQTNTVTAPNDRRFHAGKLLYTDNFKYGLGQWQVEMEQPGIVAAKDGVLDIDVPAGVTVWFRGELVGPVMISYDAMVISAGGPNDRVSDLNCFWMATDPTAPGDILAHPRSGAFAGYNSLHTYYVGLGGNGNTTTRFRRYIGDKEERPLLPENDLSAASHPDKMIVANKSQTVRLIADGRLIQYYRDDERIFEYVDPHPYLRGWFAIRTTKNHMQIRNLRIVQLIPNE
jgi:hypothetical protein